MADDDAAVTAYRGGLAAGDPTATTTWAALYADRGDVAAAQEQYRLGEAAGDALAARSLREILDK
ncbi:MAG: hypothetical protein ABI873_17805 [Marmoricola sp.]